MDKFIKFLKSFGMNTKQAERVAGKVGKIQVKMPGIDGRIMTKKDKGKYMLLESPLMYDPNISKYSIERVGAEGQYYHLLNEYKLLDAEIARTSKEIFENTLTLDKTKLKNWETNIDKWKRTQTKLNDLESKFYKDKIKPEDAYLKYEKDMNATKASSKYNEDFDANAPQTMEELGYEFDLMKRKSDALIKDMERSNKEIGIIDDDGRLNFKKLLDDLGPSQTLKNTGTRRAIARPILIEAHNRGLIQLSDEHLRQLTSAADMQGGGAIRLVTVDPVDVFRYHFGEDAFKILDDMAPGLSETDIYTDLGKMKLTDKAMKNGLLAKTKAGPVKAGEYLSQDQIKTSIDEIDEAMNHIAYGDDPYWARADPEHKKFTLDDLAKQSEEFQQYLKPENFPSDVTPSKDNLFSADGKLNKDAVLDSILESKKDFEVISKGNKKYDDITKALGIDAKPGYPITESGKPDLKVVGGKDTKVLPGSDAYKQTAAKRDRPNIRLMKNFEKELTDIDLAQEGYNLQEIDIIRKARKVMKEEGQSPNDALAWVRGEMADQAKIQYEDFMPEFDWGDFPGDTDFADGGRVE